MAHSQLTAEQFDRIFPFHLVIDRQGIIVRAGSAISRIAPELHIGAAWHAVLTAVRPRLADPPVFDELLAARRSLFILKFRSRDLILRGQFIEAGTGDTGLFLVSPWINRLDQTGSLGLSMSDLPNHDVVGEFLLLLQAKDAALADAEALTARLRDQRTELRDANAQLAAQAAAREAIEHTLQRRNASFRELVEHIGEVVFQTNADGSWTFLNPAWEEITGFTLAESLGRPFFEFLHPDDVETNRLRFEPLMRREKEVCHHEIRYRTRDGGFKWVEVHARLMIDSSGAAMGTAGTLRDVTAHHEAAELRERARLAAEHTSQQMSEFVANMSHEVRTPLNGVMGLMAALKNTQLTRDQRELVDTAYQSGQILLAIVNDLLDLSKIEAGKLAIERVPVRLRSVIGQTLEGLEAQALKKGVRFEVAFAPDVPAGMISDPVRLRQLVLNLADNAVKFTSRGSVSVSVSVVNRGSGEKLRVAVADTGVGIPEAKVQSIFDKFVQVDSSTTRHYGGTGLGLAICRQLAALMGGDIGVESRLGEGSTFWFEIALERGADEQVVDAKPKTMPRFDAVAAPRVLVAEDNLTNQLVVRLFLEGMGCHVECVSNGEDAVARVTVDRFDAVLMDGQMPGMDGYEATRRIRRVLTADELPIIAMTASAMVGDRERCFAAGMTDYLAKPLQEADLADALTRAFGSPGVLESQPTQCQPPAVAEFEPSSILRIFSKPDDVDTFTDFLIKDLIRARESLDSGRSADNRETAARGAHAIAGAAAQARVTPLAEFARRTERQLRDASDSAQAFASVDELRESTDRLVRALSEWHESRRVGLPR